MFIDEASTECAGEGLRTGDGPCPVGRCAEARCGKPADDAAVDVVEFETSDRWPRSAVPWRWLAVVVVEVPLPAHRFGPVDALLHQHAEAAPLPAVEVLHGEPLASVGPTCEVGRVAQEQVVAHQFDTQSLEGDAAVPAQRLHRDHTDGIEVAAVLTQPLSERGRPPMVDVEALEPQRFGEVPHRRQHEVQPLAVPPP
jgi:hypothetical protein